jgi:V/A-type H+-transporting ATPase subunit C
MGQQLRTYGFINAKLRARISKIIAGDTLERMIKAPSVEEAFRIVSDTPFGVAGEVYAKTGNLKLAELEILKREIGLYLEIEKYIKGDTQEFVRTLASRFEIDNLKNALRLFFTRTQRKRPVEELSSYLVRERILYDIAVDEIIKSNSLDEIVQILSETPYAGIVEKYKADLEKDRSLFRLEIALDKFYYQSLIGDIKKLTPQDRKTALRLIGIEIDIQNIDWIIRFKTYYDLSMETVMDLVIQGGQMLPSQSIRDAFQSQNPNTVLGDIVNKYYPGLSSMLSSQGSDAGARLLLIERILEQIMSYEVRHILEGYPFTIGILLSYLALKRNEMRMVMTILNAKLYDLPEDRIRAAL